jgi:hypothetical protein
MNMERQSHMLPQIEQVILILADGSRPDMFKRLMEKGELPNIEREMVPDGNFLTASTVFPSTTGPAYLPFLTGCFPGTCNVPGIRWFDKKRYGETWWAMNRFRSYVGYETYLINQDIQPGIKTIFEYIPNSINIFNAISKGLPRRGNLTRFSRGPYYAWAHYFDTWDSLDRAAAAYLFDSVNKNTEFTFVVFPGIEEFSHLHHPFHDKVVQSYKYLDQVVGELSALLKKKNRWDKTLLLITSDHGLSATEEHFEVWKFLEHFDYNPFYYPRIFKYFLTANAASMVSGNGMAHVYLKGKSGWQGRMFYEECIHDHNPLIQGLLNRAEIEFLLFQTSRGQIIIRTALGSATLTYARDALYYDVAGIDPLSREGVPARLDYQTAFELSFELGYPDIFMQIWQIFQSPRSGDIILNARPSFDLRQEHEWPEHRASHGSLDLSHMLVPAIMNIPTSKKYIRTVDIFPTILKLLHKPCLQITDGQSII